MKKSHIKENSISVFLYLLLSVLLISCDKEVSINETVVTESAGTHLRTSADASKKEESTDFSMLTSPLRDILRYNPEYLNTISRSAVSINAGGGGGGEDFHCCNGICLTVPTNPDPGTYYYPYDAFGNKVDYIGQYGTDDRQRYYVYLPNNVTANSPVVVMIPGGGWFSGQDVSILGFPYNWADYNTNESMVKDLLNNGYVVVSLLYRLIDYGNDINEFPLTTNWWYDQVADIQNAINHIRANFYTCLYGYSVSAEKIHILGESAGGHLALLYAYSLPQNSTFLKSVVSMYAPTNMNQYADTLDNYSVPFICSGNFYNNNMPYYYIFDESSPYTIYQSVSPFNCTAANQPSYKKIIKSFNLIQSGMKSQILNPSTNTTLSAYSPKVKLTTSANIIPTFIMHGNGVADHLVPYNKSTDGMSTNLANTAYGGLIGTYTFFNAFINQQIPVTYNTLTNKHVIKLYNDAEHGWNGAYFYSPIPLGLRVAVRQDVVRWLNGHN
ncbi:MAG: alpha/beta hydrolase [Sphingobacteriales bacterium]|jgi:acetyl esterase/lipase|nr:alpha/beta hydrolase [Sphingobacteriales bacterium]